MRLPVEALEYKVIAMIPVLGTFEKGKIETNQKIIVKAENPGKQMARTI
jgi:hypothetical protein